MVLSPSPEVESSPALTRQQARDLIAAHCWDEPERLRDSALIALMQVAYAQGVADATPKPATPARPVRGVPYCELRGQGYSNVAPSPLIASEDRAVCAQCTCACGTKGLRYQPFTRPNPFSYRPYAVCPACGAAEEF